MFFASWLRNRPSKRAPAPRSNPRFRPQLEALDDRLVPSTLKVTNGLDSGPGSLRYALAHANSNGKDTIVFKNVNTINLSRQLDVTTGVTIKGPGAGYLTITTNYNFGDPWGQTDRAFEVNASKPVVISGVSISDNGGSPQGAAVFNHSTLTMSNCDLSDNMADYGGAVYNAGTMTLTNCTLNHDWANYDGGAVYNAGKMTVTGCTLSFDNSNFYGASSNPGVGDGIYNDSTGTLTVGTSTFVWASIFGPYVDAGGNTFATDRPVIGSFTASASTVTAGDSLTLTATNITDANPNSSITQVLIYGPNSIGGTPLGYATQTSPGTWTFTFSTAGMAAGTDTFYAVAVDNYGVPSLAVGVTVQVV
jgi:hypothetical protein